jgi:hypothetical protein
MTIEIVLNNMCFSENLKYITRKPKSKAANQCTEVHSMSTSRPIQTTEQSAIDICDILRSYANHITICYFLQMYERSLSELCYSDHIELWS